MTSKFMWEPDDIEVVTGEPSRPPKPEPLCFYCAHRMLGMMRCAAYPDSIPERFASGRLQHTKPSKGDHGITYLAKSPGAGG